MQLEEPYAVEIKKVVEYAEKEERLIQIVRTHQHNINSAMSQTARRLKRELQRRTRERNETIAEKIKGRWRGKRLHGELPCSLDEKLEENEHSC